VLALAYAGLPVLFKLAAMPLVWHFPIDENAQRVLRDRIAARRAALDISTAPTGGNP
jgi:glycoside/pentoside/hexuronide:cation symporter, GPH family